MDSSGDFKSLHPAEAPSAPIADDPAPSRPNVSVEFATAPRFRSLAAEWRRLVERCAEPNVFMEPAVAGAMYTVTETPLHVLLAWSHRAGGGAGLIGVWLLVGARPSSRLPIRTLEAPCNSLTLLGSPVLDRDHAVEALSAMLEAIARNAGLPKLICANQIATDGPGFPALLDAASRRGARIVAIERRQRAVRTAPGVGDPASAGAVSSKRRAELRRQRKRLAERGELRQVSYRRPEEVSAAFQEFLDLEAAGWKGRTSRRGRAIRNAPPLRAFAQTMITGLARDGCAGIEALRLDGRAIAMNIWLRSGRTAFGWKMAYDETYAKWGPGSLLMEATTETIFAQGAIDTIDSCNRDASAALAQLWLERREIADLLIDVSPGGSVRGRLTALAETLFRRGRGWARRTYKAHVKPVYLRALARLTAKPGSGADAAER
ncbi:UNVERIFIED_CONTAM: GNAT family N-acetyltransferase [Methylobacteriaceae bacterium AG10]|nr:GNAT family N-acetyltransferase [Methylobacteriaceae bacterium AG10]